MLAFIKEVRSHEIAITSTEVTNKAIEIVPGFKEKSYNSIHNWFKRLMKNTRIVLEKLLNFSKQYLKILWKLFVNIYLKQLKII